MKGAEDDLLWENGSVGEKESLDKDEDPLYADSDFPWTEEYVDFFDSESDGGKKVYNSILLRHSVTWCHGRYAC